MEHQKTIKDVNLTPSSTNEEALNKKKLEWLAGFFDITGTFSIDPKPRIFIPNTNPKAAMIAYGLLKRHNINATVTEKSLPSKSSKKKRWDIITEDCSKTAKLLFPFCVAKTKQLTLFANENYDRKELSYFNRTSYTLINDNVKLFDLLKFERYDHEMVNDTNKVITPSSYDNMNWLAGIIDANADIKLDKMDKKGFTAKFTPTIQIRHHNKKVIECAASTLNNNKIGYHLQFNVSETENRGRWTITISGFKRIKYTNLFLLDRLFLKKEQINLLNLYIHKRLQEDPKSIDDIGFSTMNAIAEMNKSL